ncbi:MAG: hypothetical protein CMP48_14215 [Rickettsiales bacterium]|nr:hypothetical protein [Rickettsiales bacterium]
MPEQKSEYPIKVTDERLIKRITIMGVFSDVFSMFNIERGLVYTLKLLFSNPGVLLNLYLKEGRYLIFNSFRLLILTTAISLLAMRLISPEDFLRGFAEGMNNYDSPDQIDILEYEAWISDWYNLILWTAIPLYALFSYLFNRKQGYNYAEHVVMQSFHMSALNIITTIFVVLVTLSNEVWLMSVMLMALVVYYFWMLLAWLKRYSFWFIFKNVLGYVIANLLYLIGVGVAVALVFYE